MSKRGRLRFTSKNTGAIAWATEIANFQRNTHVDVRVHFVRELFNRDEIEAVHVPTAPQRADTLTKPHFGPAFIAGRDSLSVHVRTHLSN